MVRAQQGLGDADVERPLRTGAMATPQQRHIDAAGADVVGEVGGRHRNARVLRELRVRGVMQHQGAAAAKTVADPHQHVRLLRGERRCE